MDIKTKTCKKCGLEKPVSEYTSHYTTKDGLRPECRACRSASSKAARSFPVSTEGSKICPSCGDDRPVTDFGPYSKRRDGRCRVCRECENSVRRNRSGPRKKRQPQPYVPKEFTEAERSRRTMYTRFNRAVSSGEIQKSLSCQVCGKDDCRIVGHHIDYERESDVVWCCVKCHSWIHRGLISVSPDLAEELCFSGV